MNDRLPGFSTLAVHAGAQPDPTTGARVTPIYQTTSFVFNDADHAASLFGLQAFGNIYTRIGNPTNAVLEERVAALEGGTAGLAVASGHAAQVVVLQQLLMPGDELIAARKLYGGSINQFTHAFKSFGWNVAWADPDDIGSFERAVTARTKAIFIESIANPSGSVTDIESISAVARKPGLPLIVDNTLATPHLIRPIHHRPDIVLPSLSQFFGLPGDKYNNLARKYAPKGAGAVFTFSLKGGYEAGVKLVSNLKLFSHLANVGDTRSLVIHPASTTHSQLDDAAKIKSGAAPNVVRLSIGIEDKEDLIADLDQALTA